MGRRKAPVRRAQQARLDADLKRHRKETRKLAEELDELSEVLAVKERELAELQQVDERPEDGAMTHEEAAVTIQAKARGIQGRRAAELLRKKEAELQAMREEKEQRERELRNRRRELELREERHKAFRMQQKREQDRRRALVLERKRRLLDEGEVLREDEENAITLEDASATSIQRIARGRAARCVARPCGLSSPSPSPTSTLVVPSSVHGPLCVDLPSTWSRPTAPPSLL